MGGGGSGGSHVEARMGGGIPWPMTGGRRDRISAAVDMGGQRWGRTVSCRSNRGGSRELTSGPRHRARRQSKHFKPNSNDFKSV
jgi:hypothetical protein